MIENRTTNIRFLLKTYCADIFLNIFYSVRPFSCFELNSHNTRFSSIILNAWSLFWFCLHSTIIIYINNLIKIMRTKNLKTLVIPQISSYVCLLKIKQIQALITCKFSTHNYKLKSNSVDTLLMRVYHKYKIYKYKSYN